MLQIETNIAYVEPHQIIINDKAVKLLTSKKEKHIICFKRRKKLIATKNIIDLQTYQVEIITFLSQFKLRKEEIMKEEVEKDNSKQIIDLFRKVISSLACIEKTTNYNDIKQTSIEYLNDIINQYDSYRSHKDVNKIEFKYSEKEIVDFSNECYDKVDIFTFAEDVEFGFSELIEKILKGRENKNG